MGKRHFDEIAEAEFDSVLRIFAEKVPTKTLLDELLRRASLPAGLTPEQIETLREALAVNGWASFKVPINCYDVCIGSCPAMHGQNPGKCWIRHGIEDAYIEGKIVYLRPGPSCPWTRARERKGK